MKLFAACGVKLDLLRNSIFLAVPRFLAALNRNFSPICLFCLLFVVFGCTSHVQKKHLPLFTEGPKIVFVHVGNKLPSYLSTAIQQARLFNDCDIVVVANRSALKTSRLELEKQRVIFVACEDLPRSARHKQFLEVSTLDAVTRHGFWRAAKERFFYLEELMTTYSIENVVHLENDNMLYVDVKELMPIFQTKYPGIGATFDSDDRCIAGLLYISGKESAMHLTSFLAEPDSAGKNDMQAIADYRKAFGDNAIKPLPIVHAEYASAYPLRSEIGSFVNRPDTVSMHVEDFHALFDAAAIGQYLGGTDLYCGQGRRVGFVNEACVFNPAHLTYEWVKDARGRRVPFAVFNGQKLRINNLHIHCKLLHEFSS